MGYTEPFSHPISSTPTTPINYHSLPTTPTHFHPLPLTLTHSHSFSAHSYQIWLIYSPHLLIHTYFLCVLHVCRLYLLICLTYLINLDVYVLNVCTSIRTVRWTNLSVLTISAFNVSKCFTFLIAPCVYVLTCLHVSHVCELYVWTSLLEDTPLIKIGI